MHDKALEKKDPRESMRIFSSAWVQLLLTFITGKPCQGQTPFLLEPIHYLFSIIFRLIAGLFLSSFAVQHPAWLPLLLPGWLLTVAAARSLQVVVMHHAAHRNMSGNSKIDRWLGRFISVLLLIRDFDSYALAHRIHHSLKGHMTLDDETVKFLFGWVGLRAGMTREECWKKLIRSFWWPAFHAKFMLARLKSSLWTSSISHKAIAYSFWAAVLLLVSFTNTWLIFLIAWGIPISVFYQAATALRLAAEHTFPELEVLINRDKRYVCQSTQAVFLGEAVPDSSLSGLPWLKAWSIWWLRMIFIHGLVRDVVLPADAPVHDYHSRYNGREDWANAIWLRQIEAEAGSSRWAEPYTETWGLGEAINVNFEAISKLPPDVLNLDDHSTLEIYGD